MHFVGPLESKPKSIKFNYININGFKNYQTDGNCDVEK